MSCTRAVARIKSAEISFQAPLAVVLGEKGPQLVIYFDDLPDQMAPQAQRGPFSKAHSLRMFQE